ncbi:ImuA family protein [Xanthobacteraceae bacterium A53D]
MRATAEQLRALRQEVAGLERWQVDGPRKVPLGHADADAALGGGLEAGRLHEVFAATPADASAASGVTAMLAGRLAGQSGGSLIWLRQEKVGRLGGVLQARGLLEIGIDPARLVLGILPDPPALLAAAGEAVRCAGVGAVVLELWRMPRALDLTATRRLALAAEGMRAAVLLLRVEAEALPSAAQTRWAVRAAPSAPLEAGAPGHPAFTLELMRQRSGPPGGPWQMEWDRDRNAFRTRDGAGEALPRPRLSLAAHG